MKNIIKNIRKLALKTSITLMVLMAVLANLILAIPARAATFDQRLASVPILGQIMSIRNLFLADVSSADELDAVLPDSGPRAPDKTVNAVITAYTSTVDQCDSDPFIAASGKHVYDGMIAANWLPMGTKVKIPSLYGDKIFTVDDRMNARYGYGRMDIWFDSSKAEAFKFGVKRVAVEVYYNYKD